MTFKCGIKLCFCLLTTNGLYSFLKESTEVNEQRLALQNWTNRYYNVDVNLWLAYTQALSSSSKGVLRSVYDIAYVHL